MILAAWLRPIGFAFVVLTCLPTTVSAQTLASQLVGTWKVIRYENYDAKGQLTRPYGEHPAGYFVYDPTGHLSVQIMTVPATKPFATGDDDNGTDAEVRASYNNYVAYFGTYRVDEQKHVVTHVVEGALKPSYTGTDQPRPFRLDGDVLTIEISHADGGHVVRELHRVR